jgi:hypothetical protein
MPLLREACPGFQATWLAHLDWWKGEEPGAYNDTAEFAHYLVESFESGQTSEFPKAFASIERILNEGDPDRAILPRLVLSKVCRRSDQIILVGKLFSFSGWALRREEYGRRLRGCGRASIV